MRVYKPKFRGRDGELKKCPKWYVEFSDQFERQRRIAVSTSKDAATQFGLNADVLVSHFKMTGHSAPQLAEWIASLPPAMKSRLASFGLIRREIVAVTKPLTHKTADNHLADFKAALVAKGSGERHADLVKTRCERILDGIGATSFADVDENRVRQFLTRLRSDTNERPGISAQSHDHYVQSIKQFFRWAVQNHLTANNPVGNLAKLGKKSISLDRRHERRALRVDELKNLIASTEKSRTRYGMDGFERSVIYQLAAQTGARANELRTLRVAYLKLDGENPSITIAAQHAKNSKAESIPLQGTIIDRLKEIIKDKEPGDLVFRMPDFMIKPFRADLKAAGIVYHDEATDTRVDFHSLRVSFVTNLGDAGVDPKQMQILARHSSIDLTMNIYNKPSIDKRTVAIGQLPDLTPTASGNIESEQRATGTDGHPAKRHLASHLASRAGLCSQNAEPYWTETGTVSFQQGVNESANSQKKLQGSKAKNEIHPTGVEPVTFGSVDRFTSSRKPVKSNDPTTHLAQYWALIDRLLNESTLSDECRAIIEQHMGRGRRLNPWVDRCDKIPTS